MRICSSISAGATGSGGAISSVAPLTFTVVVAAASKLSFITSPVTLTAGNTSGVLSGTMSVQVQDAGGNPINGARTIALATSSAGGVIRNTTDTATIASVVLTAGQNTASFRYRDTTAGTPTITATSGGLTLATQIETINPAAANKIVLTGLTTNLTAGTTRVVTATIQDAFNNVVTTGPTAR